MRSPKLIATGTAQTNMTPMIDVVFLLIIFFLVSSHLSRQENWVPLDLPTAASGLDELTDRESVVVHVLPDGTWMIGSAAVELAELESILRQRIESSTLPVQIRIRTDRSVVYQKLQPLLGAAAKLGIGDIVFSVYGDRES